MKTASSTPARALSVDGALFTPEDGPRWALAKLFASTTRANATISSKDSMGASLARGAIAEGVAPV